MEPTIYKPSIYKGAGVYKTGAEGGGGDDVLEKMIKNYIYSPAQFNISLDKFFDNQDLLIKFCFFTSRDYANRDVILFKNGDSKVCGLSLSASSSFVITNAPSGGDTIAHSNEPYTMIMKNNIYRSIHSSSYSQYNLPFTPGSFNIININSSVFVSRITLYKGDFDITNDSEFILDLVPINKDGYSRMYDNVNKVIYRPSINFTYTY